MDRSPLDQPLLAPTRQRLDGSPLRWRNSPDFAGDESHRNASAGIFEQATVERERGRHRVLRPRFSNELVRGERDRLGRIHAKREVRAPIGFVVERDRGHAAICVRGAHDGDRVAGNLQGTDLRLDHDLRPVFRRRERQRYRERGREERLAEPAVAGQGESTMADRRAAAAGRAMQTYEYGDRAKAHRDGESFHQGSFLLAVPRAVRNAAMSGSLDQPRPAQPDARAAGWVGPGERSSKLTASPSGPSTNQFAAFGVSRSSRSGRT